MNELLDSISTQMAMQTAMGVAKTPLPGHIPTGVDINGKPVYSDLRMNQMTDLNAGAKQIFGFVNRVGPFDALDQPTINSLSSVAQKAASPDLLASLAAVGGKDEFVSILSKAFGADSPTGKQAAEELYSHWGALGPAQKTRGIATVGIQHIPQIAGARLDSIPIPNSKSPFAKHPLTVGDAFSQITSGADVHAFAKNWPQLDTVQRVLEGTKGLGNGMNVAKKYNLVSPMGAYESATPISARQLQQSQAVPIPHKGIGAIVVPDKRSVPKGYKVMESDPSTGETTAIPEGNQDTYVGAASAASSVGPAGLQFNTMALANAPLIAVASKWAENPNAQKLAMGALSSLAVMHPEILALGGAGQIKGALGGSQLTAGLMALAPFQIGGLAAAGSLGHMFGGKGGAQKDRDSYRSFFRGTDLLQDGYKIKNPDGSVVDVGIDGHGGMDGKFRYAEKVQGENRSLHPYDVDYTNDLDFVSSMGATTLVRLATGKVDEGGNQFGGQLANAALGKLGRGQDFTKENFNSVMTNLRSYYAGSGIKSKDDALKLLNQAFGDHRISETDYATGSQAIKMVFDNDYALGGTLMAGRWEGVNAHSAAAAANDQRVIGKPKPAAPDRAQQIEANKQKYKNPSQTTQLAPTVKPVEASKISVQQTDNKELINTQVAS